MTFEDAPSKLFGRALRALQQVQRAYALMTDTPHRITTRGTLPPLVPAHVGTLRDLEAKATRQTAVRVRGQSTDPTPSGVELDQQARDELIAGVERHIATPRLVTFGDLQQEAQAQFDRVGDYRAATTTAAAAGEALIELVHLLLLFELDREPEAVAANFGRSGLTHYHRLTTAMKDLLGGSWQSGRGVVGRYLEDLSDLRNRVVHGAYLPRQREAEAALNAFRSLFDYVRERLSDPRNVSKYPQSTMVMCGSEYLSSHNLMTKRLHRASQALGDDWYASFDDWCQSVEATAT